MIKSLFFLLSCILLVNGLPKDQPNLPAWYDSYLASTKSSSAQDYVFYVGTKGNDNNPGTLEAPFATLQKAQYVVRAKKGQWSGPILVYVLPGTYYLNETFVLEPQDGGANANQFITYAAYNGEVVLSGGKLLPNKWIQSQNGIYTMSIADLGISPQSLFVNGQRMWPARYPNYNEQDPYLSGPSWTFPEKGINNPSTVTDPSWIGVVPTGLVYNSSTFSSKVRSWHTPNTGIVHVYNTYQWTAMQFAISDVDTTTSAINFAYGGGQINYHLFNYGTDIDNTCPYFVENIFEELDAPGEFFYDSISGILFLIPPQGINLDNATIVAPVLERIISLQGNANPVNSQDPSVNVANIAISGFTFAHTIHTYMQNYIVASSGDWMIVPTGALFAQSIVNCSLANNLFDQVNSHAIMVYGAAQNIIINNNEIISPGDAGINLVGNDKASSGSSRLFPRNSLIASNKISNAGYYEKHGCGVFVSTSADTTITGNEIYNSSRAGININDPWVGGHLIQYNLVSGANMMSSDCGPINFFGRTRFWSNIFNHPSTATWNIEGVPSSFPAGAVKIDVIRTIVVRNNYIIYWPHAGDPTPTWAQGIDMDDGSSNFYVTENVVVGNAIKIGATGDFHNVTNNIIYNSIGPVFIWLPMYKNSDYFTNNIMYSSVNTGTFPIYNYDGAVLPNLFDKNLFYSSTGANYTITQGNEVPFSQWVARGMDRNSILGMDPEFGDPKSGNFTVSNTSPALKLGFHNFVYGPPSAAGREAP